MPQLIHLNGPPGIGKSTIADLYADDHPGTLNLDIDRVRQLVGGWRADFQGVGDLVRPIALSMAEVHLRNGRDVVMPQYLGQLDEIARFEAVAEASGGDFCEVVLLDDQDRSLRRFEARGDEAPDPWHDEVRRIVEASGGRDHLVALYDSLLEVIRARPAARVVRSEYGDIPLTYQRVLAGLAA